MRCRHAEPLLPKHVEGRLSAREAAGLTTHLDSCPACRRLRDEFISLAADLREPWDSFPASDFDRRAIDRWLAERAGRDLAAAAMSPAAEWGKCEHPAGHAPAPRLFQRAALTLAPLAAAALVFVVAALMRPPGSQRRNVVGKAPSVETAAMKAQGPLSRTLGAPLTGARVGRGRLRALNASSEEVRQAIPPFRARHGDAEPAGKHLARIIHEPEQISQISGIPATRNAPFAAL